MKWYIEIKVLAFKSPYKKIMALTVDWEFEIGVNTISKTFHNFDSATARSFSFLTFGLEAAESKLLESTVMALVTMVTFGWLDDDVESLMTWSRFDGDVIKFDCCSYMTSSVLLLKHRRQINLLRFFDTNFLLFLFLVPFLLFLLKN